MPRRTGVLELAVLGLLNEQPMHGYELRKRLDKVLGWGHSLSYGSLYPCLKGLSRQGFLDEEEPATPTLSRRAKIVYRLTEAGAAHFADLLADAGPSALDDEHFGVHFAFFARTDATVRLRILEGRKRRLEERLDRVRAQLQRTQERLDAYGLELQRHGLESVEREVSWLDGLIRTEKFGNTTPQ
jgi:DNA-binding PadR family transcriptional regulator